MLRTTLLAIQSLLLVIGVGALSAAAGGFLVFLIMSCVFPQPTGENWGGAPAWLFAMSCGGIVTAVIGSANALIWYGRHGGHVWRPVTWIGIAAGLSVALALSARSFSYEFDDEWLGWTAFWITTFSAIGGFLATMIQQIVRRTSKARPKAPTRRRKRLEQ